MTTTTADMAYDYSRETASTAQERRRSAQAGLNLDNPRFNNMDWPQLHMLYPIFDNLEEKYNCNLVFGTSLTSESEDPDQFLTTPNLPGNTLIIAHNTRIVEPRRRIDNEPCDMEAINDLRAETCPDYLRAYHSGPHRLGIIAPRFITIPWWWYSASSTPEQLEAIHAILDEAFQVALDEDYARDYEATRTTRMSAHLASLLTMRGSEQLNTMRNEVPTLVSQIASYERSISSWQQRLDELRVQIAAAEDAVIGIDDIDTMAQNELNIITSHPDIANIQRGDSQTLEIFTNQLPLENIDSGETTVGGSYKIGLSFGNNAAVTVRNLTHAVGSYDHPHVSEGTFCLGDQRRMVDSLLARAELSAAVSLIIDLLKQVNPDDTYTSDWQAWFDLD